MSSFMQHDNPDEVTQDKGPHPTSGTYKEAPDKLEFNTQREASSTHSPMCRQWGLKVQSIRSHKGIWRRKMVRLSFEIQHVHQRVELLVYQLNRSAIREHGAQNKTTCNINTSEVRSQIRCLSPTWSKAVYTEAAIWYSWKTRVKRCLAVFCGTGYPGKTSWGMAVYIWVVLWYSYRYYMTVLDKGDFIRFKAKRCLAVCGGTTSS